MAKQKGVSMNKIKNIFRLYFSLKLSQRAMALLRGGVQ
jgi:hypothetical protein